MKKRIATLVVAGLVALAATPALVFAVDETTTTNAVETTVMDLKARLEKRKTELKTRLTNTQKTRLQTRCKASQGTISSVKGRLETAEAKRTQAYAATVERLTALSTKLQGSGMATTELDAAIISLNEKITTHGNDLSAYKQTVSDLAEMDCAADVEAFKASLDAARTSLHTVAASGKDIRIFINDTIKPLLVSLKTQVSEGAGN